MVKICFELLLTIEANEVFLLWQWSRAPTQGGLEGQLLQNEKFVCDRVGHKRESGKDNR